MSIFKESALAYWEKGYVPIPIDPRSKAPLVKKWQDLSSEKMPRETVDFFVEKYPEAGIGLVMGHQIGTEGYRVIAIDIDDDDLVEKVQFAIGKFPVAKRGKKGLTIFARMAMDLNVGNKKLKRRGPDGKALSKPSVEILGMKTQTVIPPTIHPETQKPYEWTTGRGLLDVEALALPEFTAGTLIELQAICTGNDKHYNNLNEMTWLGEGGGGDTHDTCHPAVGHMVAMGWVDYDIHVRINSAKAAACERNGDEYNWPGAEKTIQEWIDSARKLEYDKKAKEAEQGTTKKRDPLERIAALWLLEYLGGLDNVAADQGGTLRRYVDGYWPALDVQGLEQTIMKEFSEISDRETKSALSVMHTLAYRPNFGRSVGLAVSEDPKRRKICLLNGTLDLMTGQLMRHDPEDELTNQMNFEWDDNATCPNFDKFIQETFKDDPLKLKCTMQFMSYSFIPDNSFQKMIVLIGSGGNGKGTLVRLWSDMMDPDVIGTVALNELASERKLTSLVGKLVNFSSEQNRFDSLADNILKKITGNDSVTVRKLYKEPINNVRLFVRLVLQVNEMPSTNDSSDALRRRLIMIEFMNKPTKPDPYLDQKLYKERAGVLRNYLIPHLRELYEQKEFTVPKSSVELVDEYLADNDPVALWIRDCCTIDKDNGTLSRDLFAHFTEWCKRMNFRYAISEVAWGKTLKSKGFPSKDKWVGAQNASYKMRGLKLKPGEEKF